MPKSHVRLSAGREEMNPQMQALAFMAGANSIFYCEKLLTTANPNANADRQLFATLGIKPEPYRVEQDNEMLEEQLQQRMSEAQTNGLFYNVASDSERAISDNTRTTSNANA